MPNDTNNNELTTEQLSLLETLTYLDNEGPFKKLSKAKKGQTIESFLMSFNGPIEDEKMYHSFISGKDWKRIITRVLNDKKLCSMKIQATEIDKDYGGESCLFLGDNNEAIFAYRGTAPLEWEDNVKGAAPIQKKDGTGFENDTECQKKALDWYQNTVINEGIENRNKIVIGHSKGGNKAKYITIMDPSVNKCVSFDGQGFSDEFIEENKNIIEARGAYIENHNIDNDFVNILLNDVGNATFYKAFDIGSFKRNHCPHVFYQDNAKVTTMEAVKERNDPLTFAHNLLNSFCRSLTPEEKRENIETISSTLASVMKQLEKNKREAVAGPKDAIESLRDKKMRFGAANLGMQDKKVEAEIERLKKEEERRQKEAYSRMSRAEKRQFKAERAAEEQRKKDSSPIKAAYNALFAVDKETGVSNPEKAKKNFANVGKLLAHARQYAFVNREHKENFENLIKEAVGKENKFTGWIVSKAAGFVLRHPKITKNFLFPVLNNSIMLVIGKRVSGEKLELLDGVLGGLAKADDAVSAAKKAGTFKLDKGDNIPLNYQSKDTEEAFLQRQGERMSARDLGMGDNAIDNNRLSRTSNNPSLDRDAVRNRT